MLIKPTKPRTYENYVTHCLDGLTAGSDCLQVLSLTAGSDCLQVLSLTAGIDCLRLLSLTAGSDCLQVLSLIQSVCSHWPISIFQHNDSPPLDCL
ncbi:hypothetical protein DPMN_153731 [Dreissena polymorpha]|uniref:Uncharacterized protein n=1 Tax=Dreissena polymorpha TaxID=45954 RepID=A0A9D4J534_DREPO|nr:hypothetical protein DPMN_153731 [Dreissena polymorpha]